MFRVEKEEEWFQGQRNFKLYYQCWLPGISPRAIILLVHGLAEHSGRYQALAGYLASQGFALYSYDQQGHGRSEGRRGYVQKFSDYLADLKTFSAFVHAKYPASKIFLLAHSVGGLIATAYALDQQQDFAGLVLSGPTLKPGSSVTSLSILMARALSVVLPRMGISTIDSSAVSRDIHVVDAYINDPLVYCGKISARLGSELLTAMNSRVPPRLARIHLPLLIMYGTADRLSNPDGSKLLYERASSNDKTLITYEGFFHEIFNEPGHERAFHDVANWLDTHI